ncbi:hypothetical protein LXA43DRAFT_1068597 [Ganoderma leucocontextum]|nr:hypothetical protein LXA43DRAFT_1068597 [Ganoderma leucocontextum]
MRPTPLLISQFRKPDPSKPDRKDQRNSSRSELRNTFDRGLVMVTGRNDAKMCYATWPDARRVVEGSGYKFNDGGWPSDIPFSDLSNRILGAKLVYRITDLVSRFQLAAPEDSKTTGVVLYPATMRPQFTFSVLPNGAPNTSYARPRERSQRSDTNKGRKWLVKNLEGCEFCYLKRDPTTAKYVVEAEGITGDEVEQAIESRKILLTDEILTGCSEVGREASGSRSRRQDAEEGFSESEEDIEPTDDWETERSHRRHI